MVRVLMMLAMSMAVATARGSTWWVTWTGDAYPETEGWTRYTSDPPPERWLEDGKLLIDSRGMADSSDIYSQLRPGEMTLEDGQTFQLAWRIKVDEAFYSDPSVEVMFDDFYFVHLSMGTDAIYCDTPPGGWAPFAPGEFHEFLLESSDMRNFSVYIDGLAALQGSFFYGGQHGMGGVGWGDMTSSYSLAEWDWVEAGIVPEPAGLLSVVVVLPFLRRR